MLSLSAFTELQTKPFEDGDNEDEHNCLNTLNEEIYQASSQIFR